MDATFALLISGCEASEVSYVLPSLPPSLHDCVALADTVWQLSAISRRVPSVHDSWLTAVQRGIDLVLDEYRNDVQRRADECAAHGGAVASDVAAALAFHAAAMKRVHAVVTSDDVMSTERTSGTILDALYDASRTPMQPHNSYFGKLFHSVLQCWLSHLSAWVAHGSLLAASDGDFLVRDAWKRSHMGTQPPYAEWCSRFQVYWPAVPRLLLSPAQASAVLDMGKASRLLDMEGGDPLLATLAKRAAAASAGGGEQGSAPPPDSTNVHLSSAARRKIASVFQVLSSQAQWDALSFSVALDKVSSVLQRYLWASLQFKSGLPRHLTALQNYALLGRGELFGQFLELSAPLLRSACDAFARLPPRQAPIPPARLLEAHSAMAILRALEGHLQAGPWAAAGVATACDSDAHFPRVSWALAPPLLDCVADLRAAGFSRRAIDDAVAQEGGVGGVTSSTIPKPLIAALQRHPRVLQWLRLHGPTASGGPTGVVLGGRSAQQQELGTSPLGQPDSRSAVWLASPVSCEGGIRVEASIQLSSTLPSSAASSDSALDTAGADASQGDDAPQHTSHVWLHLVLHSDARQWELPEPNRRGGGHAVPPLDAELPTPPCATYVVCSVGVPRSALQQSGSGGGSKAGGGGQDVQVRVIVRHGSELDGSSCDVVDDSCTLPAAMLQDGSFSVAVQHVSSALGRTAALTMVLQPNAPPSSSGPSAVELCNTPCDLRQVLRPVGLRSLATVGLIHCDGTSSVCLRRLRWEGGVRTVWGP